MNHSDLPFLRKRAGRSKIYWYYERDDRRTPLPAPDAPDFLQQYVLAKRGGHKPKASERTFKLLILEYRRSPRWQRLAFRSKVDYDKVLVWAEDTFGDLRPENMERRHVIRAQAENAARMRFANYIVQVLSVLFEQAIDLGWITHNPAKGIRLLKSKSDSMHRPWPDAMIDAFTEAAPFGSVPRTVFELAIGTGQRIGDVLRMCWDHIEDDGITVKQGKTGTRLWLPFTPRLRAYLEALPRVGATIATGPHGKALNYQGAAQPIMVVRRKIGAVAYTIHGWRYTAASHLAAAGATDEELQAITGHKSRAMVVKYAGAQRQRARAVAAQAKREIG